jgi:hypothetical protein
LYFKQIKFNQVADQTGRLNKFTKIPPQGGIGGSGA